MQVILAKLLAPLIPYLIAGVIALAGCAYMLHLRHQLAAATVANTLLEQTNQANAAAIAAYQAQAVKWNAAVDALGAESATSDHQVSLINERIDAQPVSADAPVAPVLAAALNDIRHLQQAAP
ncbi:MAG: hypothetical protein B7Z75_03895 [Acidocella sp. 20-57-95]|nr:MAG: hypothetical protein B7Z75_03895 [Acidocella sp. 20-57-95]OYV60274.1 MAG: hypothetical protein B7Z71_06520 [Acidocella sp. 21-58-7]HQT63930.1 hypothetical protein [Acidocella sp.]HQU03649.1 hypothetical protein [Acidocella sp.]